MRVKTGKKTSEGMVRGDDTKDGRDDKIPVQWLPEEASCDYRLNRALHPPRWSGRGPCTYLWIRQGHITKLLVGECFSVIIKT